MSEPVAVDAAGQPFQPSLIDRFNSRVERLPLRAGFFFAASGAGLVLVQLLVLWLEGGLRATQLLPVIIFNGLFVAFLAGLIFLLDKQAVAALDAMRTALDMSESETARFRYRLANMPARPALAAGVLTLVAVILMERLWIVPVRYAALEQFPLFAILFQIVDKSSAFLFGLFVYHTVRQLRLVSRINRRHLRINLYQVKPLQAFSRLTASTAVGLLVGVYAWVAINPDLLGDPLIFGFAGAVTLLALAVFVLPLLGAHRRMEQEKETLLDALDRDFETVFAEFNRAFRAGDHTVLERLNGTIASLETQQNRIRTVPTWPWKPETAQFVFAAVALPLVLGILQFLLEQAFAS